MIKITKYLRINILTAALFVFCFLSGYWQTFSMTYLVMLCHETAHMMAAIAIGLKVSHITLHPFGVNLSLKNKMVYSLADEIILYISGPLFNIFTAFVSAVIYKYNQSEILRFFYICNIMLFIMNMLPALPLDGGIILKKFLMYRFGSRKAKYIMSAISVVITAAVAALGIYVIYLTKMNFSVLLFALLMLGNMFTQHEKYNVDFVKELMFHDKKKKNKVKHIIADENNSYLEIASDFDMHSYSIVYIINKTGKIVDIMSENQIMEEITNTNITV